MRRRTVLAAAGATGFLLAVAACSVTLGQGAGWFKFLFTPQAGLNATCLSCGWHDACVYPYPWGTALDFPAACSDTGDDVYFRSFGFRWGTEEYVAFGRPFTVTNPPPLCKTTEVRIRDKETYDILGYMRYVHTYKTRSADMLMYASEDGTLNEDVFAQMAKDPSPPPPATPPPAEEAENWGCINAGYWTRPNGVHVHEYDEDGTSAFVLRDGADCGVNDRYPCAPASGGPYNPQDWWNDWARGLCIDDTDCDVWTDDEEDYLGTDPLDACPDNPSDDAWPPDLTVDTWCDVGDILMFRPYIMTSVPPSPARYDLVIDHSIDVGDILMMGPFMLTTCSP
jgi:hypothetical protein